MTDLERETVQFAERALQRAWHAVVDVAEDHPALAHLQEAMDSLTRVAYLGASA